MQNSKKEKIETTDIWKKYQSGVEHHNIENMYEKNLKCHKFYEGEQWSGCKSGDEELPTLNFIKPICKYKVATVAMNDTAIIYSAMDSDERATAICNALTDFAAKLWEKANMSTKKWAIVKKACITGEHYVYCYDERKYSGGLVRSRTPKLNVRLINKSNIYLSNEQNPSIEEQEWIIIGERLSVAQVCKIARNNGISEKEISKIVADEDVDNKNKNEVKSKHGNCTSLLFMRKTDTGMEFCRSTKAVIYSPMQEIDGLDVYPVAAMRWEEKEGSARGRGIVETLIPNQIETNRTLARRAVCVKRYSFPNIIYDTDKIENPEELGKVGSAIAVRNLAGNPISGMISYLTPVGIGGDAAKLQEEIIFLSRELEGAGDVATGQVDPTKASGEAIKAARDQSALSLNEQSAAYREFIESLAMIWYKLWVAYSPAGLVVSEEDGGEIFSQEEIKQLDINIKIDVSPIDPYSILSRASSLENALSAGMISFEEYVEALDDNGGVPKDKFKNILKKRTNLPTGNMAGILEEISNGGEDYVMPEM